MAKRIQNIEARIKEDRGNGIGKEYKPWIRIQDVHSTGRLVGEALKIDSKKVWFYFVKNNYKDLFPNICDRTRFNRTKRNLYKIILEIQKYFSNLPIFKDNDITIIDSMPVPACKFGITLKNFMSIITFQYINYIIYYFAPTPI